MFAYLVLNVRVQCWGKVRDESGEHDEHPLYKRGVHVRYRVPLICVTLPEPEFLILFSDQVAIQWRQMLAGPPSSTGSFSTFD